jgi:hypothetical protein
MSEGEGPRLQEQCTGCGAELGTGTKFCVSCSKKTALQADGPEGADPGGVTGRQAPRPEGFGQRALRKMSQLKGAARAAHEKRRLRAEFDRYARFFTEAQEEGVVGRQNLSAPSRSVLIPIERSRLAVEGTTRMDEVRRGVLSFRSRSGEEAGLARYKRRYGGPRAEETGRAGSREKGYGKPERPNGSASGRSRSDRAFTPTPTRPSKRYARNGSGSQKPRGRSGNAWSRRQGRGSRRWETSKTWRLGEGRLSGGRTFGREGTDGTGNGTLPS